MKTDVNTTPHTAEPTPATVNLRDIPDDALQAEFRRREEIERKFAWAVAQMREFAVWESEGGRARKITEWHARRLAERICVALGISREVFSERVIAESAATTQPADPPRKSEAFD